MTIRSDIEALALKIAQEAMLPDKTFNDRLEALKILNTHYAAQMKKKAPDEEDGEGSMSALAQQIHESSDGNGQVRSRTRR